MCSISCSSSSTIIAVRQAECFFELAQGHFRPALGKGGPAGAQCGLEAGCVEEEGVDHQGVAGGPGDQHLREGARGAVGLQKPAQVRHVGLDRSDRMAGRLPAVEAVDQAVERDHPVRLDQQDRKDRPLPGGGDVQAGTVRPHLERTEDLELHRGTPSGPSFP